MKTIFFILFSLLLLSGQASKAQCALGAPTYTSINVDGNVADWGPVLTNNSNVTQDGTPDRDAPIADMGRDFVRMAYTMDANNIYFYLQRAGSSLNQVTVMLFLDVNNDNGIQTNEPVVEVVWSGSNRRGDVNIWDYIAVNGTGDPLSADGDDMPGSIAPSVRNQVLFNTLLGTLDGFGAEFFVPMSLLKRRGTTDTYNQLSFGENFNFHVSSLNGSVNTFGNPNSVNDNWRKCDAPFYLLEAELTSFDVMNNEAVWTISKNESAASFELERSVDGNGFQTFARVAPAAVSGKATYRADAKGAYLRLKMTDKLGRVHYSRIISVKQNLAAVTVSLLQNPVTAGLSFTYDVGTTGTVRISLVNATGRTHYRAQVPCRKGTNYFNIAEQHMSAKGIYIIEVTNEQQQKATAKAVKL